MDNASKALIIAGAVLIAVMLVSVGVMIYQNSIGLVQNQMSNIDSLDAVAFNATFTQYCGTNKNAQNAKTLIEKITQSNTFSTEREIQIIVVDESGTEQDGRQSAFATTTMPTNQADKKVDDNNAKQVYTAKNARWNIFYHLDAGQYVDAVEFRLQAGTIGG